MIAAHACDDPKGYRVLDASFRPLGWRAKLVDGRASADWQRDDAVTLGKMIARAGRSCLVVRVSDGVGVAGYGVQPGALLKRWRSTTMPGVERGVA